VGAEGTLTREQLLTDPAQCVDFVQRTEVDALAIAIGTSHGAYKFARKPTREVLAIARIEEIHRAIPDTHLVMHGSSSVPQEWLAVLRQYGGEMPETYGVPVAEIQEGIRHGVRKVNIDTDIRIAMTAAVRRSLAANAADFDPRKFLKAATASAREVCKARFEAFGCAGNASRIQPVPLEKMAERYGRRERLRQVG
jgi:fructose-bisphosphate aldolase, class II